MVVMMGKVVYVRDQSGAMRRWFSRAFSSVDPAPEIHEVYNNFEKTYDVKLLRRGNIAVAVEFPSEEDATMFMFRWM